jgi:allantoinase
LSTLALRSTRVVTPEGVRPATLEVRDGTIVALHSHDAVPAGVPLHEAYDAVIMPGLVDTHVHVNEPGRTEWEGFATATRAAAAGGVTTLVDMPLNSVPATLTRAALAAKRAAAAGKCAVDVGFLGGVVGAGSGERSEAGGNDEPLAGLHEAGVLGFKCFLVPSGVDEFPPVGEAELARALARLAPLNTVLMAHCELPGPLAAAPAPPATRRYHAYLASRPAEAETAAVTLLLRLAEQHHARVHVVHVSSAGSLPLIAAARARGVAVTAETCPHYLTFTAADVPDGATEYKCAPPIRGDADRDALWRGLADGTLDQVVSDHSPCPPELKRREQGDFMAAWGGIASLQLGLPALWTGMRARGLPLERLAHWMSAAPARLVGLGHRKGAIAPGRDADLVAWSPEREFVVRAGDLLQRHPLTPYLGHTLAGVVLATWLKGERVFAQGSAVAGANGQMLHRETISA